MIEKFLINLNNIENSLNLMLHTSVIFYFSNISNFITMASSAEEDTELSVKEEVFDDIDFWESASQFGSSVQTYRVVI